MNFSFLHQETTRLRPQRITVKRFEVRKPPLLTELSIYANHLNWSIYNGGKIGKYKCACVCGGRGGARGGG